MNFIKVSSVIAMLFTISSAFADIRNFGEVEPGFYRGSEPLKHEDMAYLQELKIKTIVSFESFQPLIRRQGDLAKKYGIDLLSYPINPMAEPKEEQMKDILRTLNDPSLRPVYANCLRGADRTGLVVAEFQIHLREKSAEFAWNQMLEFGFMKSLVGLKHFFDEHTDPRSLGFNL